jgi:peptidoglycan hydrolase-like protein with peptidoglycan-binding domain
MPKGRLQLQIFQGESYVPITNARITVTQRPDQKPETTNQTTTQTITTDSSGLTSEIELDAPPLEFSQRPTNRLPYSLCDVTIKADGFRGEIVKGVQIYPDRVALQQSNLRTAPAGAQGGARQGEEVINILPNRLVGTYPPKIPEDPNKPDPTTATGLVVLQNVVIPEFITVHAGVPDDPNAPNYTVRYRDYIKNVASSEIFSTWSDNTIRSNVLCIVSFTLNRIYTEWYRGKGKNFDITNSTAYDHFFVYGRNIYANIGRIVDELFSTYVKRPARKQPLLTQYCDGVKVQCPGWLTQWGSKYQGDQGRSPIEILKNFYGSDISFSTAPQVEGSPRSYPGYTLGIGATGQPVRTVQTYLNRISQNYPAIPKVAVTGTYDQATRQSVLTFQKVFNLPQTGTVDYATWYRISDIYVAVTRIAELRGENILFEKTFVPPSNYRADSSWVPTVDYLDDEI